MIKNIILTFSTLIAFSVCSFAQNTAWTGSGNVGIGTTNPQSSLNIKGYSIGGMLRLNPLTDNGEATIGFNTKASETDQTNIWAVGPGSWNTGQKFVIGNNAIAGPVITAQIDGNVGIGTVTPNAKLSLGGSFSSQKFLVFDINDNSKLGFGVQPFEFRIFTASDAHMSFGTVSRSDGQTWSEKMRIENNGNVSIGTIDAKGYKFAVAGNMVAEAVTVKLQSTWPDYVFNANYPLPSLLNVKKYIDQNHHLPGMPAEAKVSEEGINLGEINKLLLKKVEELTLYLIELKHENELIKKEQTRINHRFKAAQRRQK